MTKARDLANASTALSAVSATELAFVDGVTSAIQTPMDAKAPSSTAVTLTGTQTLTNKTLTNPVISSVINNTLTSTTGEILSFTTKTRFSNGYPMTAFISTNYNGTTAGIPTATWTPLTFATPSANDVIVSSGNIDISAYNSNNVRIAFKYIGSKTGGVTTTCQLDNIKITKN